MKGFDMGKFNDFKLIPFSIVYSFDVPEDQSDILNRLILHCSEEHDPLKRVKLTQPPAPWMKNLDIVALHRERDQLRYEAHLQK